MTNKSVECAHCGARFQVPPTVTATVAKCRKCGASIDLTQAAPPAPSAPAPSAKAQPKSGTPKAGSPAAARGRASPRGQRREAPPSGSGAKVPILVGAAVLVLGIGAFLLFNGGGTASSTVAAGTSPEKAASAQTPPPVASAPGGEGDAAPAPTAPGSAAQASAVESMAPVEPPPVAVAPPPQQPQPQPNAEPVGSTPDPAASKPPAANTAAAPPAEAFHVTPPSGKRIITSPSQVTNPAKVLQPAVYPPDVTDDEKTQMAALLATMRSDSGAPGTRAGRKLKTFGHKALVPIVNQLREVDYLKVADNMFAYQLNQILQELLGGVNAGFKAPVLEEGKEQMDLQTADFNAQTTVFVWFKELSRWDTKEEFDAWLKTRSQLSEPPAGEEGDAGKRESGK